MDELYRHPTLRPVLEEIEERVATTPLAADGAPRYTVPEFRPSLAWPTASPSAKHIAT
jgi:hypothetical protein